MAIGPATGALGEGEAEAHAAPGKVDMLGWEGPAVAASVGGGNVAIVRLGLLAQPGPALAGLVELAQLGVVPSLGEARIAAIDPDDAAAMLSGLIGRRELVGLLHGVAPIAVKGGAIEEALANIAPLRVPLPGAVARRLLARRAGHIAALLCAERAVQPQRLAAAGAVFATPDPTMRLVEDIRQVAAAGSEAGGMAAAFRAALGSRRKGSAPEEASPAAARKTAGSDDGASEHEGR
jgi:hypothetical protein